MRPAFTQRLLGLAFTLATASLTPACEEDTGPTHVACVGDSITFGDGASAPQETYPAALQGMLGQKVQVRGFGRSGATAMSVGDLPYDAQHEYDAATTFVSNAGEGARVAVILFLGTNDSKATMWDAPGRKERFAEDYAKLVEHFATLPTHPTVYVATPIGAGKDPCCGVRGDVLDHEIVPFERAFAAAKGLPLIDMTTVIAGHPELLTDGVHPNDKGYEAVASKVREALASHPPKPQGSGSLWSRITH
jgi:lysophospholipase L1-like esterase